MAKVSNKPKVSDKPKKKRGFPKSTCNKECPVGYGMNQFVVSKGTPKELTRHYCKKIESPIGEKPKQPVKEKKPKKKEEPSIIPSSKIEPEKPSKKIKEQVKEKEESMFSPEQLEQIRKYRESLDPEIKEDLRQLEETIKELNKKESGKKAKKEKTSKVKKALAELEETGGTEMELPELVKEAKKEKGSKEGLSTIDEIESKPFDYEKGKDKETGCNKDEARKIAEKVFPLGINEKYTAENRICAVMDETHIEGVINKNDFNNILNHNKSMPEKIRINYPEEYTDCEIKGIHPRGTYWLSDKTNKQNVEVSKDFYDEAKKVFKKDCKCKSNFPIFFESKRNIMMIAPRMPEEEQNEETGEFEVPIEKYEDFKKRNMSLEQYNNLMKKSKEDLEKMSKPVMKRGKPKKAKNKLELIQRYWDEQLSK